MQTLVSGDLRIECSKSAGTLVLDWRGRSNDRTPAVTLAPYFRGIYDSAVVENLMVEMHFEHLEHFNSSTITALIQLIQEARTRQLKLALVYKAALKWQKLSFEMLRIFAKDELLTLRTV
jgi:hypothetical protein